MRRPAGAGRPPGTPNKITREFREAMVIAGDLAGDHLAFKLAQEGLSQEGGMVSYLEWLALKHPSVYGSLWGRLLPWVIKANVTRTQEIIYRKIEEVRADLEARGLPVPELFLLPYEKQATMEVERMNDPSPSNHKH